MKRLTKTKLIILLITITFLCGINKVGATTCTYILPYSGYDYYNDKVYQFESNALDYENILDYEGNNRFNKVLTQDGLFQVILELEEKKISYTSWIQSSGTGSIDTDISSITSCPQYLTLYSVSEGDGYYNEFRVKEGDANSYEQFLKGPAYSRMLNAYTSDESIYDAILNASTSGYDTTVALIKDSSRNDNDYDLSAVKIYNDTFADKWDSKINKMTNEMKDKCGNDWEKYVYSGRYQKTNGNTMTTGEFVKYTTTTSDTNYNNSSDEGADISCLTYRKVFMNNWVSFYDYWYTLLQLNIKEVNKNSSYSLIDLIDQKTNIDKVYFYDMLDRKTTFYNNAIDFFNYPVLGNKKRVAANQDEDGQEIQKLKEIIENNNSIISMLSNDLCSGYCTSQLQQSNNYDLTSYNQCKNTQKYNDCRRDLNDCNNCSSNCEAYLNTQAKEECQKQCSTDITVCLSNKGHFNAINSISPKVTEIQEYNKTLQNKINGILEDRRFTYAKLDSLPTIDYNFVKYTPKCSDVSIFTDIWQAMRIIAPFLLIIFGSLDYFKAVIANDMEAMKKAKSKFPKRLIAFLLLIIIPSIVSIIMKAGTNGAENTTYFRCIVTGDKGDDN